MALLLDPPMQASASQAAPVLPRSGLLVSDHYAGEPTEWSWSNVIIPNPLGLAGYLELLRDSQGVTLPQMLYWLRATPPETVGFQSLSLRQICSSELSLRLLTIPEKPRNCGLCRRKLMTS